MFDLIVNGKLVGKGGENVANLLRDVNVYNF